MQDFSDLTFLASYASLSLLTFALLQKVMLPTANIVVSRSSKTKGR